MRIRSTDAWANQASLLTHVDDDRFMDGGCPGELHLQRFELKARFFTFLHPVVVNPDLADGEDFGMIRQSLVSSNALIENLSRSVG